MLGGIQIPKNWYGALTVLPLVLFWNSCESTDPTDWRSPEGSRFAKTSVEELYERAQRNDYFAMVHLGWRYDTGTGVKPMRAKPPPGTAKPPSKAGIPWHRIILAVYTAMAAA